MNARVGRMMSIYMMQKSSLQVEEQAPVQTGATLVLHFTCYYHLQQNKINRTSVPLYNRQVHTQEDSKNVWTARFKMTFRTSQQYPGWSESSIIQRMKSCERLKIAVRVCFSCNCTSWTDQILFQEKMIIAETEVPDTALEYMQVCLHVRYYLRDAHMIDVCQG